MSLRTMLNKLRGMFGNPEGTGKPMSPDEKELEVYMERERKAKVKKLVHQYRKSETKEFLQGNPENSILSGKVPLADTPSRNGELSKKQKKSLKKHSLLNQGNMFMK